MTVRQLINKDNGCCSTCLKDRLKSLITQRKRALRHSMKTALIVLAAINVMTVGKYIIPLGWYELAFWLIVSIPAFLHCRSAIIASRKIREGTLIYVSLLAGVYLVLWWISGYADGFGYSPYSHSVFSIMKNIVLFGGIIAAQEYTRAYILRYDDSNKHWMTIVAAFSFFAYSLNFAKVQDAFSNWSTLFQCIGGTLLPGICTVVFLTWISKMAGFLPPLIFRLVPEAAQWLLPAYPKSGWQTNMMLGAAFTVFAMIAMQQSGFADRIRKGRRKIRKKTRTNPYAWTGLLVFMALVFSFSLGLLPVRPMVIATGSMLPVIRPGDMVILQNTDAKTLKVGDVIAYQTHGYQIVHRIMTIQSSAKGNSYILKGDNNDSPDTSAVQESQIVGKVVQIIPYVGLLSLTVQKIDSSESVPVQTGRK